MNKADDAVGNNVAFINGSKVELVECVRQYKDFIKKLFLIELE